MQAGWKGRRNEDRERKPAVSAKGCICAAAYGRENGKGLAAAKEEVFLQRRKVKATKKVRSKKKRR